MARAESYSRHIVRRLLHEHDRTANKYKNYVDKSRSHLNYGYGGNKKTADENYLAILRRCDEIMDGRKMQTQTNVISEWIVTYPARLCHVERYDTGEVYGKGKKKGQKIYREYNQPNDTEHCKKFFDITYNFMKRRYGDDNVIAGYVHMDETTPQIHVCVVPDAISRKTGRRTVSSASLLTRAELHNFHQDLQKEMLNVFGRDASDYILNGRTQGGYTIDELKKRKKDREVIVKKAKQIIKKEEELTRREEAIIIRERELNIREDDTYDVDQKYRKQKSDNTSVPEPEEHTVTPEFVAAKTDQNNINRDNMNEHHKNNILDKEEKEKELAYERYRMANMEFNLAPAKTIQRTL